MTLMKKCAICGGKLKEHAEVSDGFPIKGWKCLKCGETFFPSSEMVRWEVLTGRRKNARKIGKIGDSLAVRIPRALAKSLGINAGDYAFFEKTKQGLLEVKIVKGQKARQ